MQELHISFWPIAHGSAPQVHYGPGMPVLDRFALGHLTLFTHTMNQLIQ
jgi:hypothetical protein